MQLSSHGRAYLILFIGLVAGSFAAICTRYAENDGVPALVIAAGRLTLGSLALTPFVFSRYQAELRKLSWRDILFSAVAGFWLALHFILYITGLEHTSILINVVLGATTPLWAAVLDVFVLKGQISKPVLIGMGFAFIGVMCIAFAAGNERIVEGHNVLLGSILTLMASLSAALYMTIGRKVRSHISAIPYIYMVFSFAAVVALAAVFITRTPVTGYSANGYFWIVMLAIFPQLIGHSSLNITLSHFSATYVGLAGQLQVAVSIILAFFLFNEVPLPLQIIGGLAIIGGVVVATLGQQAQHTSQPLSEKVVPVPAGD